MPLAAAPARWIVKIGHELIRVQERSMRGVPSNFRETLLQGEALQKQKPASGGGFLESCGSIRGIEPHLPGDITSVVNWER
jgi:hypothetical protein